MDKSWIYQHRLHPEYIQGVKEFIKFACENKPLLNEVTCPCKRCRNVKLVEKGLLGGTFNDQRVSSKLHQLDFSWGEFVIACATQCECRAK
ncbi:hypothetical protein CsSME_00036947 [Camellia sinensis var. sinensis]